VARYPRNSDLAYTFGPGALSPAIKALIIANVAVFLATLVLPESASVQILRTFGFQPEAILTTFALWQFASYMFLHGGIGHLLFNMLGLWMFGTELERMWGTRFFTKYYFVTGIGAAAITLAWSLTPLRAANELYYSLMIGASGAVYGVLLAYGMAYPNRPIYLYFLFPIPAKYFVMIVGAIAYLSTATGDGGGVAHTAHLGGLVVGYLYLKGLRLRPLDEIRYRWLRWKMSRARSKFDVYTGGRDDDWKSDWKKHIH
jgi:membrane associated rhomboid family serine protease